MLEARYFDRMSKSIDSKMELIHYATPGTVLDVGAGGGELAKAFQNASYEVTALDLSPESVERLKTQHLHTVEGSAYELDKLFTKNSFDNVVFSSILHEIFSYSKEKNRSTIIHALQAAKRILKPNGRILIRDGLMPTNHNDEVVLTALTDDMSHLIEEYTQLCPFINTEVILKRLNKWQWQGDYASAMEALYTVNWGRESLRRESQELFALYTANEYCEVLEKLGFRMIHVMDGGGTYKRYLENKAIIRNMNDESMWPTATGVWVAEKY